MDADYVRCEIAVVSSIRGKGRANVQPYCVTDEGINLLKTER